MDAEISIVDKVRPIEPRKRWGEGVLRSAGVAVEIDDFDDVFAQIERERKAARFRVIDG